MSGCLKFAVAIVVVVIVLAMIGKSHGGDSRNPHLDHAIQFHEGEHAVIRSKTGAPGVPLQPSLADINALIHATATDDERGAQLQVRQGIPISNGVRVLVVEDKILEPYTRKVRVLEGKFAGQVGWVVAEWLDPVR